jgi:hypothetical protein
LYKNGDQESKTGPVWGGWYQWEWAGYKEKVKEGECGGKIMYIYM